ncbi:PREDICTED: U-box domain-containing protein 28-like [Ipomoea nil]|uniref:U-box domain-containing protein 28-like n=1 Tax=Ipomoea nil TaxID=35883 RepID=UPI000900E7C7|nr:PREDICTED: U-box domain-containing protein 28-like [Ipomoea nil]
MRDDLYISVPSLFRCPISLDVMKSPVSLSTGVTYDRSSIQRWLDSGNNTCPATMQVLHSKDLVPNHTLQRLIQIWSESVQTRRSAAAPNSLTREQARHLIHLLKNNFTEHTHDHISKLVVFAKESDENRKFLVSKDFDLVAFLISVLVHHSQNIRLIEKTIPLCVMLLDQLNDKERLEALPKIGAGNDISPALILGLRQGNSKLLRISASKLLDLILAVDSEAKNFFSEIADLYSALSRLLVVDSEWDAESAEAAISCLISLAMLRKNRARLARNGAVGLLGKALSEAPEMGATLTEKVLRLLELLSTCKDGRSEICQDKVCLQSIVKKVLKVSTEATEHGVTILWSLCCLFRDHRAQDAVAKSNGMPKILLIMQSNCSPAVRQMAGDLLKVFRVNSKAATSLSTYDTKTIHIMPF